MATVNEQLAQFNQDMQGFKQTISDGLTGLQGDIQGLDDKITALQNAANGELSPENQQLLVGIKTDFSALADRAKALDEVTPPVAPPTV